MFSLLPDQDDHRARLHLKSLFVLRHFQGNTVSRVKSFFRRGICLDIPLPARRKSRYGKGLRPPVHIVGDIDHIIRNTGGFFRVAAAVQDGDACLCLPGFIHPGRVAVIRDVRKSRFFIIQILIFLMLKLLLKPSLLLVL